MGESNGMLPACKPRIVRLTINGNTLHYATWRDAPLEDLTLADLRPWPALDGAAFLKRILSPTPPEA